MNRALLGVLVLVVCGLMVAPVAMAGKGGGGKFSTIDPATGTTNGFKAGPTQGDWFAAYRWNVAPTKYSNDPIGPGGQIVVYQPLALFGNQISSTTHGEWFYIYDLVKKDYISPSKMAQGTYTLPSPIYKAVFRIMIEGIANPDAGEPGQKDTIQLVISLDSSKLPNGQQVYLTIGAKQVSLSGVGVQFHYDDMHQIIDWDVPLYGFASHSFVLKMDR